MSAMHMHAMRVSQREIINAASGRHKAPTESKHTQRADSFCISACINFNKTSSVASLCWEVHSEFLNPILRAAQRPFTFIAFFLGAQRFSTFLNAFVESFAISFFLIYCCRVRWENEIAINYTQWEEFLLDGVMTSFKPDCRREKRKMCFAR